MPKGKPGRSVGARAASKPRARAPVRRERPTAQDSAMTLPKRADTVLLAAEVERLERELTAARQQLAALEARADIDPLTELPNRRAFERELGRSLAYVKRHGAMAALLYLDLDDFKRINDRHGHSAGDEMLRVVAAVLGRHIRESDVVARIGGDEFALLLWNCDAESARAKAMALEGAVGCVTATYAGSVLAVGASVGVALLLPADRPAEILDRADRAMYVRKAVRRAALPTAE